MQTVRSKDRARILVVATGGTIGSAGGGRGLAPVADARAFLRGVLERSEGLRPDFDRFDLRFAQVGPWLSENVHPAEDWTALATTIARALEADDAPDGVVVAHGTDTLAWTASALSFLLEAPSVPIVLTGAVHPPDHPASDAGPNLRDAALVAANEAVAGCYVVFLGAGGHGEVFRANRIVSMAPWARHFTSGDGRPLGEVRAGALHLGEEALGALPRRAAGRAQFALHPTIDDAVKLVAVHPALRPDDLVRLAGVEGDDAEPDGRALVLDLYHSGTACTRDTEARRGSLAPAIRRCVERGVLVFGLPSDAAHAGRTIYATTRDLLDAGMRSLPAMTREAACTKLMWLLGQHPGDSEAVAAAMESDLRGEVFAPAA